MRPVFVVPYCARPPVRLSADVRDASVQDQRHAADQAHHQPHPALSGHASRCGQGGGVPQPLG